LSPKIWILHKNIRIFGDKIRPNPIGANMTTTKRFFSFPLALALVASAFALTAFAQDADLNTLNTNALVPEFAGTTNAPMIVWAENGNVAPGQNIVLRVQALANSGPCTFQVTEQFRGPNGSGYTDTYFAEVNNGLGWVAGFPQNSQLVLLTKSTVASRWNGRYDFTVAVSNTGTGRGILLAKVSVGVGYGLADASAPIQVNGTSQGTDQHGSPVLKLTGRFPVGAPTMFSMGMPSILGLGGGSGLAISPDGQTLTIPVGTVGTGSPASQVVVLAVPSGAYSTTMGFHLAK
jgi:hypothetical protein